MTTPVELALRGIRFKLSRREQGLSLPVLRYDWTYGVWFWGRA